jgi:DNA-binding NarL/FixJ family response regulator
MSNPWNLPPREAEVMTCLANKGAQKVVAAELGLAEGTVKELVGRAKKRIGARTSMSAVIQWDRWERKAA